MFDYSKYGFTEEQLQINATNKKKATELLIGNKKGYVLHHKDPSWVTDDPDRYIQWNPEDLEVMTKAEHNSLHNKLRKSWEGENNYWYGSHRTGKDNPMYGKHHTEENKRKASIRMSAKVGKQNEGRHWYTNGIENKFTYECPEGFRPGLTFKKKEVTYA